MALSNLGKEVSCLRCLTQFRAVDPQATTAAEDDPMRYWIDFTDHGDCKIAEQPDEYDVFRIPR